MKRYLYRILIALHPRLFRERFGGEMLSIFDESTLDDAGSRLFTDSLLSLLRQWFIRSGLWKMGAGAVISGLMLLVWGYSVASPIGASTMRDLAWHAALPGSAPLGEDPGTVDPSFDQAAFSRDAQQAVAILARIRESQAREQLSQSRDARRFASPEP